MYNEVTVRVCPEHLRLTVMAQNLHGLLFYFFLFSVSLYHRTSRYAVREHLPALIPSGISAYAVHPGEPPPSLRHKQKVEGLHPVGVSLVEVVRGIMYVPPYHAVRENRLTRPVVFVPLVEYRHAELRLHRLPVLVLSVYAQLSVRHMSISVLVGLHGNVEFPLRVHIDEPFSHRPSLAVAERHLRNALPGEVTHRKVHPHAVADAYLGCAARHTPHLRRKRHALRADTTSTPDGDPDEPVVLACERHHGAIIFNLRQAVFLSAAELQPVFFPTCRPEVKVSHTVVCTPDIGHRLAVLCHRSRNVHRHPSPVCRLERHTACQSAHQISAFREKVETEGFSSSYGVSSA